MTLALTTVTSFGLVLTADSRQTYHNMAGMARIGSDSGMKLFQLNRRVGAVIAGRAFLPTVEGGQKSTGWFIEQFKKEKVTENLSTKEIALELNRYLEAIFVKQEFANLKKQVELEIKKDGGGNLSFSKTKKEFLPYSFKDKQGNVVNRQGFIANIQVIVAGIDSDSVGRAYSVYVPGGINNERDTLKCGALWIGQTNVLVRVIKGFSPEIGKLAFLMNVGTNQGNKINKELTKLEYLIGWQVMTLQDAVDFCVLMTRTTESIQRFSDGTPLSPGGITGLGGDIDVAIITPEEK